MKKTIKYLIYNHGCENCADWFLSTCKGLLKEKNTTKRKKGGKMIKRDEHFLITFEINVNFTLIAQHVIFICSYKCVVQIRVINMIIY